MEGSTFFGVASLALILPKVFPLFYWKRKDYWHGTEFNVLQKLLFGNYAEFGRIYHRYEVHGMENVRPKNCLLVGYHSRPTLETLYLVATIQPQFLITHIVFHVPIVGYLVGLCGAISSKSSKSRLVGQVGSQPKSSDSGFVEALVDGDRPLVLYPGGVWEFSKSSAERHKVLWKEEAGFARVIAENKELGTNTSIVPFFTRNCEKQFLTSDSWYDLTGGLTRKYMKGIREGKLYLIPCFVVTIALSVGFFFTPLPVKLETHFGEPVILREGESAVELSTRVAKGLQGLIEQVNALPERVETITLVGRANIFINGLLMTATNLLNVSVIVLISPVVFPTALLFSTLMAKRKKAKSA